MLGESSNCSVSLYDIEGLLISWTAPMAASVMFDPVAVPAERTQVLSLVELVGFALQNAKGRWVQAQPQAVIKLVGHTPHGF